MKKAGKIIIGVFSTILMLLAFGVAYLTLAEYKPEEIEEVQVEGNTGKEIVLENGLSIVTYNIGYGANDKNADFFLDGGKDVLGASKEAVEANMKGNLQLLRELGAEVVMIQEADRNSKRSYKVDEINILEKEFSGEMSGAYSRNYLCSYVPYPLPVTTGRVDSGLVTLNSYQVAEAKRYRLPCPFTWPTRVCQLKRGLLVERLPVAGSDKEVIIVNVHLEAYDSGEGRKEQTKVLTELLLTEYEKGNYVIAGGDFNQYLPGADLEKYPITNKDYYVPGQVEADMLPEDWSYAVDNAVPSTRLLNEPYNPESGNTQYYILDGFILSPNVKVKGVRTIDSGFMYSDHNPVYMEIVFE